MLTQSTISGLFSRTSPRGDGDPPAPVTPPVTDPPTPAPATPPANQDNQANMWRRKYEDAESERKKLADADEERRKAEMTEIEREKSRADQAEKDAAAAKAEATRLRIAHEKGIPADALGLLTGGDEATLTAQADQILALRGTPAPVPVVAGTVTQPPANQQPSIDERIDAAQKAGNTSEAIRLKRERAFGAS